MKLPRSVQQICKDNGLDSQILDSSLSEEELLNELKKMGYTKKKPFQKDEVEEYERLALEKEREFIQQQIRKEFNEILSKETSDLKKYYFCLEKYIETVLKAKHIHSLFITGKSGLGKSFTVIKTLSKNNYDFKVVLGNISPLELYHTLYEYRKGVLCFDDTTALLHNKPSMSLLMSACWNPTNRRICSWLTTSKKLKAPPRFEFEGKILFIANEIPSEIEPIVSRCLEYRLDFSFQEILNIMAEISKLPHPTLTKNERLEVLNWIKENCDETTENFDLRLQNKIETLYEYNKENWKELALKQIKKDEDLAIIKQLMESGKIVKAQIQEFIEKTGKSRREFFYLKKKYLPLQSKNS